MTEAEQSLQIIYWAYHWYDEDERTLKTIGHFSTEEKARAAIDSVRYQPGFRDHPEGFDVDSCAIDRVCWPEGFV